MKRLHSKSVLLILFLVSCLVNVFFVLKVLAHSPLTPGSNESLDTASLIPEPSKSWAVYAELHEGGEAQYYYFNLSQGARIFISLLKSTDPKEAEFLPSFVLMGPNVTSQGTVPSYVEVPSGYGSIVVNGAQPSQAMYEPFSPSSLYQVAEIDIDAPGLGTHYIAVFEPSQGGHYSLAVGYIEKFTIDEWIFIPFNLINIYLWEGQSLLLILAPLMATLIIGLVFMVWQWKTKGELRTVPAWFAGLAGLLFLGTGFMTLLQMVISVAKTSLVPEIIVTVIFALIPILLGVAALRVALKKRQDILRTRIYLAIIGIAALFIWAGLIAGPILAIVGGLLPRRRQSAESRVQPNTG